MKKHKIERMVSIQDLVDEVDYRVAEKAIIIVKDYCYVGRVISTECCSNCAGCSKQVESEWLDYKDQGQKFYIHCLNKGMTSAEATTLADAFIEHEFMWYASQEFDNELIKLLAIID